ncbi:Hypothetical protein, putative, partial [Bodo saltans]
HVFDGHVCDTVDRRCICSYVGPRHDFGLTQVPLVYDKQHRRSHRLSSACPNIRNGGDDGCLRKHVDPRNDVTFSRAASVAIHCVTIDVDPVVKAKFAITSIVGAFVRMSIHATTADAVRCLSAAISNIVNGADETVKASFATTAVVDSFVRMSTYATTELAVLRLSFAICTITTETSTSVRRRFATAAMMSAFVSMSYHATDAGRSQNAFFCDTKDSLWD